MNRSSKVEHPGPCSDQPKKVKKKNMCKDNQQALLATHKSHGATVDQHLQLTGAQQIQSRSFSTRKKTGYFSSQVYDTLFLAVPPSTATLGLVRLNAVKQNLSTGWFSRRGVEDQWNLILSKSHLFLTRELFIKLIRRRSARLPNKRVFRFLISFLTYAFIPHFRSSPLIPLSDQHFTVVQISLWARVISNPLYNQELLPTIQTADDFSLISSALQFTGKLVWP